LNLNQQLLALSDHQVVIAIVCAAVVVYSLTMALVIPKFAPNFPGRANLGLFVIVSAIVVGGILATVEIYGVEEADEVEAEQIESAVEQATEPLEERPETEAESESGQAPAPAPPEDETALPPGDPVAGATVYATAGCGACHTLSAADSSGAIGPNLDQSRPSFELTVDRVTNGAGGMPAFAGQLTEEEIQNVAAFVAISTRDDRG
jgi:mono/diheme cytochrome c family protein